MYCFNQKQSYPLHFRCSLPKLWCHITPEQGNLVKQKIEIEDLVTRFFRNWFLLKMSWKAKDSEWKVCPFNQRMRPKMKYGKQDRFWRTQKVHETDLSLQSICFQATEDKILMGIAAIIRIRIFSTEVDQAYQQSAEKLMRNVFIKPPKGVSLNPNQLLKLQKSLYVLPKSGGHWERRLRSPLQKDIGMTSCISDAALVFKIIWKTLSRCIRNSCR